MSKFRKVFVNQTSRLISGIQSMPAVAASTMAYNNRDSTVAIAPALDLGRVSVFNLEGRNRQAEQIIQHYARCHAAADVGIGVLGTLVPGATIPALVACIAVQAPLVYQPLSAKIASIYCASPDDVTNKYIVDAAATGGVSDIAVEFGREFMMEIGTEILREAGLGFVLSALPLVGGMVGAGLDAAIAATLTWRVGTMTAMYYQNGGQWISDRKETYERASRMVGPMSHETSDRVNLDDIPLQNPEIGNIHLAIVKQMVEMMASLSNDREQILKALLAKKVPERLVMEAIRIVFA